MKHILFALLAILSALLPAFAEANRIISTAPGITETLYALGLGPRVVGVSTYCNYPPEARKKVRTGTFLKPDAETILSLKPDLIFLQKVPGTTAETLRRMGLRVVEIGHGKLEAILDSMRTIAAEAGAGGKGEALVGGLRKQLDAVAAGVRSKPVKSVVFIVGRNPGNLTGLIAAGGGSYFNDLFEYAGGRNIFAQSPQEYLKISMEELLARNPEVIIDMGDMSETTRVTEEQKRAAAALWAQYPSLRAARSGGVHAVASDIYVVPGPRLVEAAKAFAQILHPAGKQ